VGIVFIFIFVISIALMFFIKLDIIFKDICRKKQKNKEDIKEIFNSDKKL
jgi:hypothetical protein